MTSRMSWILGWLALNSSTTFCSTSTCSGDSPVPKQQYQRICTLFGSTLTALGSTLTTWVGSTVGSSVAAAAASVGASAAVGAAAVASGAAVARGALVGCGAAVACAASGAAVGLAAGVPPHAASTSPSASSEA